MTAHRILILGAGYAGLAAAIQLAARVKGRDDVRVTLVNPQDRFTERLRLHMTATGQQVADFSIPELLDGTGCGFERGWVTAVDADARAVRIDDSRVLRYDTLVYALGSVADTGAIPGAEECAYTLNSAHDATLLAEKLRRLDRGTVVVCGSGLTGIESAAEIATQYPGLTVELVGRDAPGAAMNEKARRYLSSALDPARGPGAQRRRGGEGAARRGRAGRRGQHRRRGGAVDQRHPGVAARGGRRLRRRRARPDHHRRRRCGRSPTRPRTRWATRPPSASATACMHGTCQGGMPTGVHAALSIVRTLNGQGAQAVPLRLLSTQPVSLGRARRGHSVHPARRQPAADLPDRAARRCAIRRR